jgi:hypothetical protein
MSTAVSSNLSRPTTFIVGRSSNPFGPLLSSRNNVGESAVMRVFPTTMADIVLVACNSTRVAQVALCCTIFVRVLLAGVSASAAPEHYCCPAAQYYRRRGANPAVRERIHNNEPDSLAARSAVVACTYYR